MFQHQNPVGGRYCDRAAGTAFADNRRDQRNGQGKTRVDA
jgi:hypothetical protein